MDERRTENRRPLDYDVTCYIDGARLDAHALNVSQRGAFVGTELGRPVPVGALAGLVFISETTNIGTTFLFGRVIRQQDHPIRGFAVNWEKAVSAGRAGDLKSFLNEFLGVQDATIDEEVVGPGGSGAPMTRCVYRFEPFDADAMARLGEAAGSESFEPVATMSPDAVPPRDAGPARDIGAEPPAEEEPLTEEVNGINFEIATDFVEPVRDHSEAAASDIESCIGTLDVSEEEISALRIGPGVDHSPIHVPPMSLTEVPVPVIPPVNPAVVADSVSCDMEGVLVVDDARLSVVVSGLSPSAAVISSPFMPIDGAAPVVLEIVIGSRKGVSTIRCHGRISGIERGRQTGFTIAFTRLDEGESAGIFSRYLKWLQFNGPA